MVKKGSLTRSFSTDPEKEKEGVWVTISINDDHSEARMRVKRMGQSNKPFMKELAKLNKKFRMLRGSKDAMEQIAMREAFVDCVLVDWENIENIKEPVEGEEHAEYMPFSAENANLLFREIPDLFDFVVAQAQEIENFQTEANEDEAKN